MYRQVSKASFSLTFQVKHKPMEIEPTKVEDVKIVNTVKEHTKTKATKNTKDTTSDTSKKSKVNPEPKSITKDTKTTSTSEKLQQPAKKAKIQPAAVVQARCQECRQSSDICEKNTWNDIDQDAQDEAVALTAESLTSSVDSNDRAIDPNERQPYKLTDFAIYDRVRALYI
jgi:hypothetical protein